jgi:hypothetical protein
MCSRIGLGHAFDYARVTFHSVRLVSIKKQSGSRGGSRVVNKCIKVGEKYIAGSAFINGRSSKGRVYHIR